MCGEGFNICCALNRYFGRSGILCEASGKRFSGTLGRPLGGHLELWRDPRALIFACEEPSCALQGCQERPRRLQERPRKLQERPRGLREVSKRAPKGLLKASKRLQEGSKRPPRVFERVFSKSNGCPGGFLDVSSGSRESICFKL